MIINFGDKTFELQNFPQYESIRQTKDFLCECSYSDYHLDRFNMIGYCGTPQGFMAVFECPKCFEKYKHHIGSNSRYSEKGFKQDAGLALFLQATR